MISFGIGYGQIDDFNLFLKEEYSLVWEDLSVDQKTTIAQAFLSPASADIPKVSAPDSCTFGRKLTEEVPKKPDIMSFYREKVRVTFEPETLKETSMSKAFLTAMNQNGWVLEIVLKDGTKNVFPFISEDNMNIIVNAIWADVWKYARSKGLI